MAAANSSSQHPCGLQLAQLGQLGGEVDTGDRSGRGRGLAGLHVGQLGLERGHLGLRLVGGLLHGCWSACCWAAASWRPAWRLRTPPATAEAVPATRGHVGHPGLDFTF